MTAAHAQQERPQLINPPATHDRSAGGLSRPRDKRTGSPGGLVERGSTVMTRLSRRDTPPLNQASIGVRHSLA